ncbi:MAG: MipA/OmpV family protein [Gammaproteobacteria bacterium]|nr:MipA/OmpV family protein [Gammaproteobacteria bacterium]
MNTSHKSLSNVTQPPTETIRALAPTVIRCVLAVAGAFSTSVFAQDVATELDQLYVDPPAASDVSPSAADWRGHLGIGVVRAQRVIGDTRKTLVPLISVSYRDTLYWQAARGGVWLLKNDDRNARLGLVVKARGTYDPDTVDELAGMEQRDTSIEAGVNGQWITRPLTVAAAYYTDVSNKSDGDSATLTLSHPLRLNDRWSLTPTLSAEWLSAEVVNYYYGVRSNEATAARPEYQGKSAVNLRVGAMARFRLARDWSLIGSVGLTRFGSGVADSPIAVDDKTLSVLVGGVWHF